MPLSSPSRPGRRPNLAVRALWQERLKRFDQSGLSASAFCAQHRLSLPSFYAWRRRLRDTAVAPTRPPISPRFVPVRVLPASTPVPVEVVLPSGAVLRLAPGCDLAFVRSLVQSLGGASC